MPEAVQRNKNQEELTDLQIEHSRKRKKLVSEQDTDIQSLKQTFVKQKEAATEQGDAAVNHIKKNQTAELERAQASREKTQGRAQKQTAEIEDSYKNKIEQVKESRQATVERVRADTQKKVNETETFSNKKLEEIRSHSNSDMKIAQDRYNKQIDNMKTSTRDRIAEITAESDKAIKAELAEGTAKKEEVRDHNQKDVTQLEKQGQASISDEKQVLENRKLHLNKEYEKTFNRQQEAWMSKENQLQSDYTSKLQNNKEAYDDQLKNQNSRFRSKYSTNNDANQTQLQIQSRNNAKALNEQKKDFLVAGAKYDGKEQDPFYKVQDRGSHIEENDHSYVIRAYVPAHEKDAVKVTIQKDKASVEGQRAFKDQFETEDKKVATATYQSFREDFPFDKPVATEGMTRQREGDYMVITVPKILNRDRKI